MNTRRPPLPTQSNGSQPPSSDRVGARPRTSGDTGAAGHGLTRRAMVLAVGSDRDAERLRAAPGEGLPGVPAVGLGGRDRS